MNPPPICMTCDNWHPHHPLDGWCTRFNAPALSTETCFEHVPVKIKPIEKLKNPLQLVDNEEWFS